MFSAQLDENIFHSVHFRLAVFFLVASALEIETKREEQGFKGHAHTTGFTNWKSLRIV